MAIRPYTQPEVFSLVLRSMKMHLTSSVATTIAQLEYYRTSGQFQRAGWEADSLHYLSSN